MPFEFKPSDWDWSDVHQGLTEERRERSRLVVAEIVKRVGEIVEPHGLAVEVPEGIFSAGVQGDAKTYTPIVMLSGPFPGHEVLAKLSSKISNTVPANRVTFEFGRR